MKLPTRKSVLIVGDGPSADPLRFQSIPQAVYVLAVNHASIWLPRCDAYFTCFPDPRQRFLMNNRRQGVRYFCAAPSNYGSAFTSGDMFGPRERNVTFLVRNDGLYGISEDPDVIHGGNSVWGALGLAHHIGADRVAIAGLDGDDRPRVSGGKPADLSGIGELFASYDGKPEVVNGSPRSNIKAFPRMGLSEAISWLL